MSFEFRVNVRVATTADLSEIVRLLAQLGYPSNVEELAERWVAWERDGNLALVADVGDGKLLGVGTLHLTRVLHRPHPVGRITALVVDETARGHGIGKAIVREAEVVLRNAGCGLLEITSNLRRTDAHAFYESLGYEKSSVRLYKNL